MNLPNHILTTYNIERFALPHEHTGLLIGTAIIFSILPDVDIIFSKLFTNKPENHLRTWFQEPISALLVALPISLLVYFIFDINPLLVIIPWVLHIILDYLTVHEVSPLAPFKNNKYQTIGFFAPYPRPAWYKEGGSHVMVSELWLLLLNIGVLFI